MAIASVNSIHSNSTGVLLARFLNDNTFALQKSLARLTSGLRIISAGDDPGGLASVITVDNQRARINAVKTGITNAVSFAESQNGFLEKVADALDRMSELSVLAQSSTITDATRSSYQSEFAELQSFVSITGSRTFNGISLFGTSTREVVVDTDANKYTISSLNFRSASTAGGLASVYSGSIVLTSTTAAATAQQEVTTALQNLGLMQAKVGSQITRLGFEKEGLTELDENLKAVSDNIQAVDISTESAEFSRLQLLTQSGTEVLAQWNVLRANLLRLLQ